MNIQYQEGLVERDGVAARRMKDTLSVTQGF